MKHMFSLAACALLALAGCRTSYEARYRYGPMPHQVVVEAEEGGDPVARALVSIPGVRDATKHRPYTIRVQLRVDSVHGEPLVLLPDDILLLDGDLVPLGPPLGLGEQELEIPAGGSRTMELQFPLEEGQRPPDRNLDGLSFRWSVRYGERIATVTTTFERWLPTYVYPYDPWYRGPYYGPYWRAHVYYGY